MFRLSRLVWRDASARYWRGLALVLALYMYLERAWPPAEVRQQLWSLSGVALGVTCASALLLYLVVASGPTRQLVASARLHYWRQFPIPTGRWRAFHAVHLGLLHLPIGLVCIYLLNPVGLGSAVGLMLGAAAIVIAASIWWFVERDRQARSVLGVPRFGRRPAAAIAHLLVLALVRRRPVILVGLCSLQFAVAWLGAVAAHNVAEIEPDAAVMALRGFGAAAACVCGFAFWTANRQVASGRPVLDVLPVSVRDWLGGVGRFALLFTAMPAAMTGVGAIPLGVGESALVSTAVLVTGVTATLAAVAWAARAERSRSGARAVAASVLASLTLIAVVAVEPLWLLGALPAAWVAARREFVTIVAYRRRFENEVDLDDD